ncbi:MAG: pantoate--beta-alanine ligase [Sulfuriflexus sp.]|nr:pantoate--beta-alanine ligase [Sulfuriflexus sp.]
MSESLLQINDVASLQARCQQWRDAGERIAFVPTMGNLHEGHLQLVDLAKAKADRCIVSIFVNPTQFGPDEDFDKYPRTLEKDCELLKARGADLIFLPTVSDLYGDNISSDIHVPEELSNKLCAENRPGHFDGVATIVAKLLEAVKPNVAIFGNKDYQQVQVIQWLVKHLELKIKIIGAPIVREDDGLAMSSRNQYLTRAERQQASRLHQVLECIADGLIAGRRDFSDLEAEAAKVLNKTGWQVDYVQILDPNLAPPREKGRDFMILAAANLGVPRLIDNLRCIISAKSKNRK